MTIIGAVTVGQSPRVDVTADIAPILEGHAQLYEAGAMDGMTGSELAAIAPEPGDYILVSRLRDGSHVRFAKKHILGRMQGAIDDLVARGAETILVLCTGEFGEALTAPVPLLYPDRVLAAVVPTLSDNITVVVPDETQRAQSERHWTSLVSRMNAVAANPYLGTGDIERAITEIEAGGADLVVLDCIGYSAEMRDLIRQRTGARVLLPRTLMARLALELVT